MIDAGVDLRFYNRLSWRRWMRNLYRDHRKLLLIDQTIAVVGGTGVTDEFWTPGEDTADWHEVMVQIRGPLVLDWQALFDRQWLANDDRRAWKPATHFGLPRLPKVPATGPGLGRVAYADARQHRDILQSLIRALNSGHQRIWLATPYFLPTWSVRRALRRAACPAPGGGARGGCAFAVDRATYRSPVGAVCRAPLLPAFAQIRGADL